MKLAYEVSRITEEKIGLIDGVMRQTGLLALNARLEAARAGSAGTAFSVVAQEMGAVAQEIRRIGSELRSSIASNIGSLESAGAKMVFDFRGTRFTDLARSAVEIIDRNLYERSCDVRWWATDSAVVEAAEQPSPERCAYASSRLATILRSYTVYLDLWIADANGKVIANGKPDRYPSVAGADVSREPWFQESMRTASGDDFAVADVTANPLLGGAAVATYGAAIRKGGETNGKIVGVLGIFFDWAPQAETVVNGVGLDGDEKARSRVLILDAGLRVIAASDKAGVFKETYPLDRSQGDRGFYQKGGGMVAYSLTPGYETYKGLGWYGVLETRT